MLKLLVINLIVSASLTLGAPNNDRGRIKFYTPDTPETPETLETLGTSQARHPLLGDAYSWGVDSTMTFDGTDAYYGPMYMGYNKDGPSPNYW